MAKFSAPQASLKKTSSQKNAFWHFLENFDKKIAFFGARSPSVSIHWRQRRLKKPGRSARNEFRKKYQGGDPLGWQGVESLRGEGASAPCPLNPRLIVLMIVIIIMIIHSDYDYYDYYYDYYDYDCYCNYDYYDRYYD